MYACFDRVVQNFVAYAQQAASMAVSRGANALSIDLTSNFGGYVALGQACLLALSPALYAAPAELGALYQFRYSRAYASALQFVTGNASLSGTLAGFEAPFFRRDSNNAFISTSVNDSTAWYTTGVITTRGKGGTRYSEPSYLQPPSDLLPYVPAAPVSLDVRNLVLLTDGLCGSMCGQFLKLLRWHDAARIVYVGGLPGVVADSTSFTGGFVLDYDGIIASFTRLQRAGWTPPPGVPIPRAFHSTAIASVNLPSLVNFRDLTRFAQFHVDVADVFVRSYLSTTTVAGMDAVAESIGYALSMPVTLQNGTVLSASALRPAPLEGTSAPVIILAVVAGIVTLVAVLLLAMWFRAVRKHQRTLQQPRPLHVIGTPPYSQSPASHTVSALVQV